MKRLSIFILLVLAAYFGFGQATPVTIQRIADASTVFGINIPVGTKIVNLATKQTYRVVLSVPSTDNITTALAANRIELEGGGSVTSVTVQSPYLSLTGTSTIDPKIHANVGIAKDSLVKMDSTATSGMWAKFGTDGLVGRSTASVKHELGIKTAAVYNLEQAADSLNRCIVDLGQAPVSTSVAVQLNGMTLKPTTQYTIVETTKIRISTSVYKYDQIQVSYSY